jgi:hypothetical protein
MIVYHRSPDDTLAARLQRSTVSQLGGETEQILTGRNFTTCERGSARLKVMHTLQRLADPTARLVAPSRLCENDPIFHPILPRAHRRLL